MEEIVSSMGIENAVNASKLLSMDASQFGNEASYEYVWAVKTFKYAETHFKLISSFDSSKLRLTKYDDQIYRMFKRYFKDFKIDLIEIDALKTEESKARWRPFCEHFKGKIEDYNFGTLLRIDCSKGYSEDNTLLVPRIQFIAIELARNRRGLNTCHFLNKKDKKDEKKENETVNDEKTDIDTGETANQVSNDAPADTENLSDAAERKLDHTER